jgi:hypothetical protein
MVNEKYDPTIIENGEQGRVYSLQSGSGGFHASSEKVAADRRDDGTYRIIFVSPGGSTDIEKGIESGKEAIQKAREEAGKRISVGMPGTGRIDVPDFDLDKIPEEP